MAHHHKQRDAMPVIATVDGHEYENGDGRPHVLRNVRCLDHADEFDPRRRDPSAMLIRAGQMVAIGADGKVRAADTGEYQWMKRFSNWSTDPTERLLYEIMKGKAST
jgi:hypothetical protein